jgi:pteridine reductase
MAERPVALITGGARRVGRAIATRLAEAGCDLVLTYRTSDTEASSAKADLERLGAKVTLAELDLDDLGVVESFGTSLATQLPRLDVLVHNASIYKPTPLAEISAESAMRFYRVNALAPLLLSRALAPKLGANEAPGAIVAMADMHVLGRPRVGFAEYAMSKAALVEMVRTLARELAPKVRVNAVAPGVVAFPEHGYESDPEAQAAYVRRVPLARAGTPEDAAEAVKWLALDATYVTGEVIRLDGGRWLA